MGDETMTVSNHAPTAQAPHAVAAAATNSQHRDPETQSGWWRAADLGVLGVWIAVVGFTLQYHEKWADEAQAWLIARDLDLKTIWFHELRYEGSPGLWHTILWIAQHVFHAKYGALGYIGMAGATAGAAVLIFKAPFPRYIRWPLAFTYFMVYQYAVIARPYTLLPLLAFVAALIFKDIHHPERMTVVLVLLANLSLHGTILAGCFGLGYVIEAYKQREAIDRGTRRRYWVCIGVMAATFLVIVAILKPTPDVGEFAKKSPLEEMPAAVKAMQPSKLTKLESAISGAFLDYWVPSALFIALAGWWFYLRRRFVTFALPVGLLTGLYAVIHGYAHHQGTIFTATLAALWIAWPESDSSDTWTRFDRKAHVAMLVAVIALCALNLWDAEVAIRHEYLYPYSGAEDAANYLKSAGADKDKVVGFLYGVVGIQPYFEHNILANIPTAYYHHGLPLRGFDMDPQEFRQIDPDYVVAFTEQPQLMASYGLPVIEAEGYEVVHLSDGYMLYKRSVYVRQLYFILRRVHAQSSKSPSDSNLFHNR